MLLNKESKMHKILTIFLLFINLLATGQGQPSMVNIKGGIFLPLYSLDSQKTIVQPFLMDVFPVTNEDYKKFILQNLTWSKSKIKSIYADTN